MRGWASSEPYLHTLLSKVDIMCIQEHMLYDCEKDRIESTHIDFSSIVKCSKRLNSINCGKYVGNGGVGILYKHGIKAVEIKSQSDRICGLKVITGQTPIYVICVYLPQVSCTTASFDDVLMELNSMVINCSSKGDVLIAGDMNVQLSNQYGPGSFHPSRNGDKIENFVPK